MMSQEWLPAIPTNMARKATSRNPEREVMVRVEPRMGPEDQFVQNPVYALNVEVMVKELNQNKGV